MEGVGGSHEPHDVHEPHDPHDVHDPHDPHGDPFLRTRFAVPARPVTFLRRARLAGHLDQALRTPLTMVNGSAGAGKTLLVADWAAELDELPVAWLTTDADGQDPGMFWAYLLQALRTSGCRCRRTSGSRRTPTGWAPPCRPGSPPR